MALCEYCRQEMNDHPSCLWNTVIIKRQPYLRLRYGQETRYGSRQPDYWQAYSDYCPDCAVSVGGLHHFGCDWDRLRLGTVPTLWRPADRLRLRKKTLRGDGMNQEAYEALRQDLAGGHASAAILYRRLQEVQAKEKQLEAEREQAQAAGQQVPALYEDETHRSLVAERHGILADLQANLQRPRLSGEEMKALRAQLTPEEKEQLRQELTQRLQSSPPDIRAAVKASVDKAIQTVRERHGSTPEAEAAFAKVRKLQDEI